jgi:MinD superfamily P-loop ATPase
MKELVIISGKGGTGKTTFVASFAALTTQAVLADCDVDAADLHLLLHPTIKQREEFRSGVTAYIDPEKCTHCGKCQEVCRFDAIDDSHVVNTFACEGCRICWYVCPVKAIDMRENVCGEWFISETKYGPMVHARLKAAEENSGKLVALVREQAKYLAEEQGKSLVLIDGSPGIGCPVISSIAGATMVLVVTEPTLSGLHDLQRVAELTAHFSIPTGVCVNKYDLNHQISDEIKAYCSENKLRFLGKIPYDRIVVEALVHQIPIVEYSRNAIRETIARIWEQIEQQLAS